MLSYIITYGSILLYYSLFFLAVSTSYKNGIGQLKDILKGKGDAGTLLAKLVAGIFFLGTSTSIVLAIRNVDVDIATVDLAEFDPIVWIVVAAALVTGSISAFKKISPTNSYYHSHPISLTLSFLLIRTLFLIVYELFFRAAVLFVMIEDIGIGKAVIVNVILYVIVHWFDKKERYGSILMGFILCGASIYYQSVWPAIIIHLSLALSHEITLLVNNKSLIKKSWS